MKLKQVITSAAATLLLGGFVAITPQPAQAAEPLPVAKWSAPIPKASSRLDTLTHLDGGITLDCSGHTDFTVKSFGPSGGVERNLLRTDTYYMNACDDTAAVSANGVFYGDIRTGNSGRISSVVAYKDSTLLWTYPMPCGGEVNDIEMGPDGTVYILGVYMNSPCSSNAAVINLSPLAATGKTTPTELSRVAVKPAYRFGSLAVYGNGVVVRTDYGYQYVVGGKASAVTNVGSLLSYPLAAHHASGRVWLPIGKHETSADPHFCDSDTAVAKINAYEPGGLKASFVLPNCSQVYNVRPTPSGGVVLHYMWPRSGKKPQSSEDWEEQLTGLDASGKRLWTKTLTSTWDTSVGTVFAVDLKGNVALSHQVMMWRSVNGSSYRFPEVRFEVLNGLNGVAIPGMGFAYKANTDTASGPSYLMVNGNQPAIAKDVAYVAIQTCTNFDYGCSEEDTKLHAINVPGLEMDYPRGAILGTKLPTRNMVVMGDSYSAGLGAPPYDPKTTITYGAKRNECSRSKNAYAQWVERQSNGRIRLAGFFACSGAVAEDVKDKAQFKTQPPQIKQLAGIKNVDVVLLTIGGNDIEFVPFARICVWEALSQCVERYKSSLAIARGKLPAKLNATFAAIKKTVGIKVKIIVLGYPQLVPFESPSNFCDFMKDDVRRLMARKLVDELNNTIEKAADKIGVMYTPAADSESPFWGHGICSGQPYLHGPTLPAGESYHPNGLGHQYGYTPLAIESLQKVGYM